MVSPGAVAQALYHIFGRILDRQTDAHFRLHFDANMEPQQGSRKSADDNLAVDQNREE